MTTELVISETVPAALAGQRIDRVVAMAADVSRSRAVALLAAGKVTVSGAVPDKPSHRVEVDDVVVIELEVSDESLKPDPSVPITIVHQDDDVVVVDKQPGLVVHPGSGVKTGTLVQGLMSRVPALRALADEQADTQRPGIVHRIRPRHLRVARRGAERCGLRASRWPVLDPHGRPPVSSAGCRRRRIRPPG